MSLHIRWSSARAILGAIGLAVASPAAAQDPYRAPEGDFVVVFPMTPTVQSRPAHRSNDIAERRYADEENGRTFMVTVDEYPQNVLPPEPNEAVYDRLLRSYAKADPASLKTTRPARLAGRPCLEGVYVDPDANVQLIRVMMLGDRIYQVTYIHADGVDAPGAGDAFFNSFKILAP